MLKLGFAEADITPDRPAELVGFYREDSMSRGVLKPLMVQAAVWEGPERCCLVAIDNIGLTRELSDALRDRIGRALGIGREQVMLCFSHTHAAPEADNERWYYEQMSAAAEDCVLRAAGDMCPVSAGWANGRADIGVNRRTVSDETDDRVGILKICDAETGRPKLLVLRVTAHGNVLKRDNCLISPDYFGNVRETAGSRFSCPVMVIQGAAGNTAPRFFCSKETPVDAMGERYVRSETALQDMADLVTESVAGCFDTIAQRKDCTVDMYSRHLELTADVPGKAEALRVAEDAAKYCGIRGTGWLERVAELNAAGVRTQREDVEMQYFSLGGWRMCGGAYEFMAGFALETEKLLEDEFFYLNGYTNGCLLYFPTEEEYDAGGYEVFWSLLIYYVYIDRVFPFRREAASELIRFVVRNLKAQGEGNRG